MKASLKFREDQRPLARAKIPISILGLPFLSGASAGDARELRLDLATAFDAGPSLRLSYRPNDPSNPFSLVLKTGIGAFGSPAASPFSMSAEFNLLSRSGTSAAAPAFSILFKPRLGDFHIRKTTRSTPPIAPANKNISDGDFDGSAVVDGPAIGFPTVNGIKSSWKQNGFAAASAGAGAASGGGIQGLLGGVEVSARSVLPLWSKTAVRFRWGVRVPPELRTALAEDVGKGRVSLGKLPLLVMSKISIEHVPPPATEELKTKKKSAAGGDDIEVKEACMLVRRQLEGMQAENGMLRRAVEELRADVVAGGKAAVVSPKQLAGGTDVGKGGARPMGSGKRDVKSPELKAKPEDEELKKALMGAIGAGI